MNPDTPQYYRPSDALLREHYRQCILACMRGTSRHRGLRDFDPEVDLGVGGFNLESGGWWSSEDGRAQLEVELSARLQGVSNGD